MKRIKLVAFIVGLLVCLMLTSCAKSESQFSVPKTLTITAKLPASYPEELKCYNVTWYEQDAQKAIELYMHGEPTVQEEYKIGTTYRLEKEGKTVECLNVFSGDLHGGFRYSLNSVLRDRTWQERINLISKHESEKSYNDIVNQQFGNDEMQPYAAQGDLAFETQQTALKEITTRLQESGISNFSIYNAEVRDMDTMNANREIYRGYAELMRKSGVNDIELMEEPFTENDEHYFFEFRQILDEVPFSCEIWQRSARDTATETSITAYYAQDGLFDITAENLYEIGEAFSTVKVIRPEDALDIYIEEYSKAIHFENTEITDVELNYVVVMDRQGMYARPAWMISMATTKPVEGNPVLDSYYERSVIAVSADTGIILERETDTR